MTVRRWTVSFLVPPRLRRGDRVRLVSPASTPTAAAVAALESRLDGLGLEVELGTHVLDEWGYLAGRDEDRLRDFNDALVDDGVRAVIATRGGKGAYRIADALDFEAARGNPKLIIGFSEITVLQLALLKESGLVGLHGAAWSADEHGQESATSFETAAFTTDQVVISSDPNETTAALTTSGRVGGRLIGGSQDLLATASGWALPSLDGAILLLEAFNMRLGHIDRQLTMLTKSGALRNIVGVAVGQYTACGSDEMTRGDWSEIDVLRDRLTQLQVPILGGLPIGHGVRPRAVPIGTHAVLDANNATLTVDSAVQ